MKAKTAICGVAAVLAAHAAHPQSTPSTSAAAGGASALETVTVTARKRTETAQDVPLALTAIDSSTLETRNAVSVADLPALAPNLHIHAAFGGPSTAVVYLRGFGTSQNDPAVQPPVAITIDGIYQATLAGSYVDLFDLERVEVLAGPQNTLVGKNSPVGAINFYTKRPTGEWGADLELEYGRYDRLVGRGALNFPIVDGVLAGRVSAMAQDGGDYIENVSFPSYVDTGGKKGSVVRASLLFTPSDNVDWLLTSSFTRDRSPMQGARNLSTANAYPPLIAPSLSCTVFGFCNAFPQEHTTGRDLDGHSNSEMESFTSNLTWRLDPFSITSLSGYKHASLNDPVDVDGTPVVIYHATKVQVLSNELSQELRLNSTEDGVLTFDNRLDWLLGVYYFKQDYSGNRTFVVPGPVTISDYQDGTTESTAGFAHAIYKLTEQWNVSLGLRYTSDEVDHSYVPTGFPVSTESSQSEDFSNFSMEFGVQYKFSEDVNVFARYAEGYAAGGFNGVASAPNDNPSFDPQTVKSYELGAKTEWLDRRLRANVNVFFSKYDDLQKFVSQASGSGVTAFFTKNVATAEVTGVELELEYVPVSALRFGLIAGYLDAKYTDFNADVIGNGVVLDLSDQRFPWTPEWTANANAGYEIYSGNIGTFRGMLEYDYRSSQAINSIDTPVTSQSAYGLFNASLSFEAADERYTLTFFGKNILDKHYFTALEPTGGLATMGLDGMPATWGIKLATKF